MKENALKRLAAIRFLKNEVYPADVPAGVRAAVAGWQVNALVGGDLLEGAYPDFDGLDEEALMMWGSDFTFRPLPGGSWAVLSVPLVDETEWKLMFVVDAPAETGAASLPELHLVTA